MRDLSHTPIMDASAQPAVAGPDWGKLDLAQGAINLVRNCAEVQSGQKVLVVAEDPKLGWFDTRAPRAVARAARAAGADVTLFGVGAPDAPPADLAERVAAADIAIFFARIGDQDRFVDAGPGTRRIVSYARTADALGSGFGQRDHAEMVRLKERADSAVMGAARVEITCPLGTRLTGPGPAGDVPMDDVAVRRFPLSVPAPVPATGFSGQVVLAGHLTPTGSRCYDPPCMELSRPVTAHVDDGRILGFDGDRATVGRVRAHYDRVAQRFGIAPDRVHSWHAGIHDACTFSGRIEDDPDLWSNTVFGNPRYVHFHTCGDYPPGEICWMVENPTIRVDGRAVWDNGSLKL